LTAKSPIPLDISVLIQVSFVKKDQMYSVLRSLTADNVRFPPGLSMEMLVDVIAIYLFAFIVRSVLKR